MRMVVLCRVIVLATALGGTALAARAQTTPPPGSAKPSGQEQKVQDRARTGDAAQSVAVPRFSLQRVDGGYLRLDAENGTVAFCAPRKPSWSCGSVSDGPTGGQKEVVCTPRGDPGWSCEALDVDRAALEKGIAGLQHEVTSLKQDFDSRQGEANSLKQEFDRRRKEVASLKQEVQRLRAEVAFMKQEFDLRQDEIASLKQEFDSRRDKMTVLKEEITALRALPPPPAEKSNNLTITLPGPDDLARAGTYLKYTAQDAWHRLVEMISHFQRDVMRKS